MRPPAFFTVPEMVKANPEKWEAAKLPGGDLLVQVLGFGIALGRPPIREGFRTASVDWKTVGRN